MALPEFVAAASQNSGAVRLVTLSVEDTMPVADPDVVFGGPPDPETMARDLIRRYEPADLDRIVQIILPNDRLSREVQRRLAAEGWESNGARVAGEIEYMLKTR
jgi:hypothetical protein